VCVCVCVCVYNYFLSLLLNISADMPGAVADASYFNYAQYMSRTRATDTDQSLKICKKKNIQGRVNRYGLDLILS